MADSVLSLGFSAISWIEHYLIHGPGDVQGRPIELDDEFAAFIVKAYRLNPAGERTVRRGFLSRSKGRSKSGLAAMVACYEALGPCRFDHWAESGEVSDWGYEYELGEPVGAPLGYVEILNVATEEGQAGNTYDAIYYMLNPETASTALVEDYGRIDAGITRTILPNARGFIEPVTSADSSKDGGKSTFIVADETHLWTLPRLKRLHGIMTRNLLKRKVASGWMLETSTMYAKGEGSVAEGTHDYAKSVASGKTKDRSLLFDHKQASDKWDLTDPAQRLKALHEAYGPAAEWMNLDAISASWDDPQVSEGEFRRFWLNQPVAVEAKVYEFPVPEWREAVDANPENSPANMSAFAVEVDLNRTWASIGAAGKRSDGRVQVEVVDRRAGVAWVAGRCRELDQRHGPIEFVVAGSGPATALAEELERANLRVKVLGARDLAAACASMVDAVVNGEVAHGPDGELDQATEGCTRRDYGDGGFVFSRRKSSVDITPLLAVTLARWVAVSQAGPAEVWSIAEVMAQIQRERAGLPPEPTAPTGPSVPTPSPPMPTFHAF